MQNPSINHREVNGKHYWIVMWNDWSEGASYRSRSFPSSELAVKFLVDEGYISPHFPHYFLNEEIVKHDFETSLAQ